MGKCPFWSTKKEVVKCYSDCPMYEEKTEEELCPFKEITFSSDNVKIKEDYSYSEKINEEEYFDFSINEDF